MRFECFTGHVLREEGGSLKSELRRQVACAVVLAVLGAHGRRDCHAKKQGEKWKRTWVDSCAVICRQQGLEIGLIGWFANLGGCRGYERRWVLLFALNDANERYQRHSYSKQGKNHLQCMNATETPMIRISTSFGMITFIAKRLELPGILKHCPILYYSTFSYVSFHLNHGEMPRDSESAYPTLTWRCSESAVVSEQFTVNEKTRRKLCFE